MRTPDVAVPNGSTVHYDPAPRGELIGTCWLCGCLTTSGHPKNKIIKPTFTDSNLAKAPWSGVVCDHCAWALSYRSLRNYSILATWNEMRHPSRAEVREVLLNPPEPPFVLCVADSGQRWLHIRSKITYRDGPMIVRFEDLEVRITPLEFARLLEPIERLYQVFTKDEIASGTFKSHKIQEFGIAEWERLWSQIARHRASGAFKLALFVAQRKEEETECITASRHQTKMLV